MPPSAEALIPTPPPRSAATLRQEERDLPRLVAALRESGRGYLCVLSARQPPPLVARLFGLPPGSSLSAQAPPQILRRLLASGRPLGSAEFSPFQVRQLPTLHLADSNGRWALPLLLATKGDRRRVAPDPARAPARSLSVEDRVVHLVRPGRLMVNVFGSQPGAIFPHVSYGAVLSGQPLYDRRSRRWVPPRQFFRDRIVFLDTSNQPSYDTPVGPFQATELLAMATDNLLTMNVLAPPSPRLELFLLLLLGTLAGHLSIGRSPIAGAVQGAVLFVCFILVSAVLFVFLGLWLPTASVAAATAFAYLLVIQFVFTVDELELERQRGERAQREQEVSISRAIQTSLLPAGHLRSGPFEIVARSEPAREVGGDFYNLFALPALASDPPATDRIAIVLGDVSGKGVQGAMYMTVATTLIEARAEAAPDPNQVLEAANAHLYPRTNRLRMFVTVFYGVLDARTGQLRFASAGQVPPVLANGDGIHYIPTRGLPLGALRDARYASHETCLAPGDTLVLASDGFIEARDSRGEALGYPGFLEVVARHTGDTPHACLEGIFRDVPQFSGDAEDQDDRTLIVIRHYTAPSA